MKRLFSVFGIVFKGLSIVFLVGTVLLNAAVSYILFMPDDFPKPFNLMYLYPTPTPEGSEEIEATPTNGDDEDENIAIIPEDLAPGQGLMFNTGTKIVNLADPGGRKYLKTTIVLEFAPTDPRYFSEIPEERNEYITEITDELNSRLPVINDSLTTLLSSKTFEEIYTVEAKVILRQEIVQAVNSRLADYEIMYVYFTEFVVQ
jgi:flagellar basal body-associated protein FliL